MSFIDPKKSLLAKISDPKKSLVLNLLIGRNCINFVAGGSHTGRMYYPPPSSSHPLPSDHVRQIPGFVRDSDTDRDSRASAESSGGSSPSMPHGEQQQVPHPGSQQMLYHGTPHQSVQTAGVCTTPGKVTPTYVAICFGNPNIFWLGFFPFVWPSKHFLACQFPSLTCHLALGTLLFHTLTIAHFFKITLSDLAQHKIYAVKYY